jgi:ribosomal protein L14E/L6E/L27E
MANARPSITVGQTVTLTRGQYKGRTGTVTGITSPVEANGFLYLLVVDLPAGVKTSTWTYEGRTVTQQFLVPERKGVRVMPTSAQWEAEEAEVSTEA